jgi:hypothetical protein
VAVLSGSARQRLRDDDFATEDTDARLGEKLAAEAAAQAAATPDRAESGVKLSMRVEKEPDKPAAARATGLGAGPSILNAVTLLVGFNLLALFIGIPTNWWGTLGRGWPVELLFVGLLLAAVMHKTRSIWLLIPAAIVLGNGALFSFYSITHAWRLWIWLWPLEPLLVGGAIYYTFRLTGDDERASEVVQRFPHAVWRPTIGLALIVAVLGLILGP